MLLNNSHPKLSFGLKQKDYLLVPNSETWQFEFGSSGSFTVSVSWAQSWIYSSLSDWLGPGSLGCSFSHIWKVTDCKSNPLSCLPCTVSSSLS